MSHNLVVLYSDKGDSQDTTIPKLVNKLRFIFLPERLFINMVNSTSILRCFRTNYWYMDPPVGLLVILASREVESHPESCAY
jgi:hypothetical protein